jgi:16S rRNA (guanine527-N7)-methyltransferase
MLGLRGVYDHNVSRETLAKLDRYLNLVVSENGRQNLIGRNTVESAWERHIRDSAQLLRFVPGGAKNWVDIGSGAGFPGLVVALLDKRPLTLVEPRRLRADFLQRCVDELSLRHVQVFSGKAEKLRDTFGIISARAVASLGDIFRMTAHLAGPGTCWVLPKGQSAAKELAEVQASWQGRFRLEPSLTSPDAVIVVADGVRPKRPGAGEKA